MVGKREAKPETKAQKKKRTAAAAEQRLLDGFVARVNGGKPVRLPPEKGA